MIFTYLDIFFIFGISSTDGQDILSESTIEDIITDTEIDLNDNNNLQQEVYSALEIENEEYLTQCLRCSVHTFQLCVEQGFKITTVNNTVVKARKVNNIVYIGNVCFININFNSLIQIFI